MKSLFARFSIVFLLAFAGANASAQNPCKEESRLDIKKLTARVLVIAEGTHGTAEAPAFVSAVLCNFVRAGIPVILAWETPRDAQEAINVFMESKGALSDRKTLIDAALHAGDGRASLAVLEMLESVRRLRSEGARVGVSLVDNAEVDLLLPLYPGEDKYQQWSQSRRQFLMAGAVEARLEQYPDHKIVFFTSHASRTVGQMGSGYESATLLLSRRTPVYVVGLANGGGHAWRCQGPTLPEAVCKEYEFRATAAGKDVDASVNLGIVTASPPASPNPDPIYVPPPPQRSK